MAYSSDGDDLPSTWPFRAAGTLAVAAMVWFCLGMGLHDVGDELPNYMPIFFGLLIAGGVLILGGAAYNIARERGRTAQR